MKKASNGKYTIDYEALEKACAVKTNTMIILVQPHNPTGRVYTASEIRKIGEICRKYGVIIVSDEVHIDLVRRNQKCEPVMKVLGPQGVITTTAINKTFNLAGLGVTNTVICDPYLKAKFVDRKWGMNPFCVAAVEAAYTKGGAWVDQLNEYSDKLSDYTLDRIHKELPKVKVWKPEGTYVLWLDFSAYGLSDEELDAKFAEAKVLVGGGSQFDAKEGNQYRRMILACPKSVVKEVLDRLAKVFKK
jgi:cystathionine beta-lyase